MEMNNEETSPLIMERDLLHADSTSIEGNDLPEQGFLAFGGMRARQNHHIVGENGEGSGDEGSGVEGSAFENDQIEGSGFEGSGDEGSGSLYVVLYAESNLDLDDSGFIEAGPWVVIPLEGSGLEELFSAEGSGQGEQSSAEGQGEQSPAEGLEEQSTAEGQEEQSTAEGQVEQSPAEGQGEQSTAEGQGEQSPAEGQGEQSPAEGQGEQSTAEGQGEQSTAEGQGEQSTAEGTSQTATTQESKPSAGGAGGELEVPPEPMLEIVTSAAAPEPVSYDGASYPYFPGAEAPTAPLSDTDGETVPHVVYPSVVLVDGNAAAVW